ncbi:SGNH/GDSL hydrolase family protein [Candidatus Omnitrophota bacterium]
MFRFNLKKAKFWILYSVIFIILAFFTLEGAARLLKLAPKLTIRTLGGHGGCSKDKYLPYKSTPFRKDHAVNDEFEVYYEFNSVGFRDVEHSFKKPEGVFRILGLGDSFTEGAGANFEDTYLFRLEEMLNSREGDHPNIEIIKAGTGGYSPESERLMLQHYGVKYHPDLILVGFLANDVYDAYVGLGARTVSEDGYLTTNEAAQLGRIGKWLFIHSHLFRIALTKYVNNQIKMKYDIEWAEVWYENLRSDKAWRVIDKEFSKMKKIAEQIGANIVFVHIPQQPNPIKGWGKEMTYPAFKLYEWCKKRKVHFLDITPEMSKRFGKKQLYHRKDGHCNAEGYKVVAETTFTELINKELVP